MHSSESENQELKTDSVKPTEAFLHPRRTAALVDSLTEENAALREAVAEAERGAAEADEARAEAERTAEDLRAGLKEQEKSQQELMRLLLSTRSDLEGRVRELQERLDDAAIDNRELEEIYAQIQRMTESQAVYRQRIADLKALLAEARAEVARLSGRRSSGLRPSIPMEEKDGPAERDCEAEAADVPVSQPDTASHAADSDWLLPLPADL